jgi:hypothetical protein
MSVTVSCYVSDLVQGNFYINLASTIGSVYIYFNNNTVQQ